MVAAERARTYATLADSTRRWVAVMDTKAGFMFAVHGALLTFMWTAARLGEVLALARWLAMGASLCSLLALLAALWIIIPRAAIGRLGAGSAQYRPISFYGYVARVYAAEEFGRFESDLAKLDDADFAREAMEEHFTVSRIVEAKATWVSVSGGLTLASMALAGLALLVKTMLS